MAATMWSPQGEPGQRGADGAAGPRVSCVPSGHPSGIRGWFLQKPLSALTPQRSRGAPDTGSLFFFYNSLVFTSFLISQYMLLVKCSNMGVCKQEPHSPLAPVQCLPSKTLPGTFNHRPSICHIWCYATPVGGFCPCPQPHVEVCPCPWEHSHHGWPQGPRSSVTRPYQHTFRLTLLSALWPRTIPEASFVLQKPGLSPQPGLQAAWDWIKH